VRPQHGQHQRPGAGAAQQGRAAGQPGGVVAPAGQVGQVPDQEGGQAGQEQAGQHQHHITHQAGTQGQQQAPFGLAGCGPAQHPHPGQRHGQRLEQVVPALQTFGPCEHGQGRGFEHAHLPPAQAPLQGGAQAPPAQHQGHGPGQQLRPGMAIGQP